MKYPFHTTPLAYASYAVALVALAVGLDVATAPDSTNPLASLISERPGAAPLTGTILQALRAGSYTYLQVQPRSAADEPLWVVVLGAGAAPGESVRVRSLGRKTNFHSPRLGRSFPELVFGVVTRET